MMFSMYEKIFLSEPFKFLIGETQTPIFAHAEAISRLSAPLKSLITGSMKEAQTKTVEFKEIETDDFVRFCQFAYTGDYFPPRPRVRKVESVAKEGDGDSPAEGDGIDSTEEDDKENLKTIKPRRSFIAFELVKNIAESTTMQDSKAKKERLRSPSDDSKSRWGRKSIPKNTVDLKNLALRKEISNRAYIEWLTRDSLNLSCYPSENNSDEDFTPVFLGHAQMYKLGDMYDVEDLKTLALQKMHRTLTLFRLHPDHIGTVVELIRFTYWNTHSYNEDPLRLLVREYVVCEIKVMGGSCEFSDLLAEGGEFVTDLWRRLRELEYFV